MEDYYIGWTFAAAITAHRHSRQTVVTASVNNVNFGNPIPKGSIVTLEANISRAFPSSMEIFIDVWIEDKKTAKKLNVMKQYTHLWQLMKKINLYKLIVCNQETELEKKRFNSALRRRQLSLILAGKWKLMMLQSLKRYLNNTSNTELEFIFSNISFEAIVFIHPSFLYLQLLPCLEHGLLDFIDHIYY